MQEGPIRKKNDLLYLFIYLSHNKHLFHAALCPWPPGAGTPKTVTVEHSFMLSWLRKGSWTLSTPPSSLGPPSPPPPSSNPVSSVGEQEPAGLLLLLLVVTQTWGSAPWSLGFGLSGVSWYRVAGPGDQSVSPRVSQKQRRQHPSDHSTSRTPLLVLPHSPQRYRGSALMKLEVRQSTVQTSLLPAGHMTLQPQRRFLLFFPWPE